MKIAILDFASNSVDTIYVDEAFIDKHYSGEVEEFLDLWCGYPTSSCQWMSGDDSEMLENFNLTLKDFGGDDELDVTNEEIKAASIHNKTNLEDVMNEYGRSEVCMGETLGSMSANGLTIEEAFELYIKAMNHVEGDKFYRTDCDGETINLTE